MYLNTLSPEPPSELRGYLGLIPSGAAGIRSTLHIMRAMVRANKKNLVLRDVAARQFIGLAHKDFRGQVSRLFEFVRRNVRYVRDIHGVETVQTPEKTLELGYGDCDDSSVLLATLLESTGHPTRFVAVGTRNPDQYEHVYVETRIGNSWIALDPTELRPMGWRPEKIAGAPMIVHN